MDFGKEKFGGPFTEEEVEDVKTFLRLIPLLICLDFYVVSSDVLSLTNLLTNNDGTSLLLDSAARLWLLPIILIPLYHFLIRPLIRNCVPSLLKCIIAGLGIYFVSLIMLLVIGILSVVKLNDTHNCFAQLSAASDEPVKWYWKLVPYTFCLVLLKTVLTVLLYVFVIAQSPEKMKGLSIGIV